RHRAAGAAAIGNDAERAAVVAALLHLHDGAGAAVEPFDRRRRGLARRENIAGRDAVAEIAIGFGAHLLVIAEHGVDFLHRREGRRVELRGAGGEWSAAPDAPPPPLPRRY